MSDGVRPRVLLVDDDETVMSVVGRVLSAAGFDVCPAGDGQSAKALLDERHFDLVVSDIAMPGMDGISLLRSVRERDLDLPVVLMTGGPAVETAIRAVEYGALRYLVKPVKPGELVEVARYALQIHELAKLKREALSLLGEREREAADRAGLETAFSRALDAVWIAYQPIVSVEMGSTYAHEAFLRSSYRTLSGPAALLNCAERLGRVHELGRTVRQKAASGVSALRERQLLFVNLHPEELEDESLYDPSSPLSAHAGRVVLEITERASLNESSSLDDRLARLRGLGYRLALDDLGAGYAGLTSFVRLQPEFVKIDQTLVRDVDLDALKRRLVASMVAVCRDMGMAVVCEGVETEEESRALREMGADLLQGFLFAKPSPSPVQAVPGFS